MTILTGTNRIRSAFTTEATAVALGEDEGTVVVAPELDADSLVEVAPRYDHLTKEEVARHVGAYLTPGSTDDNWSIRF
jgi:hypothetical protein